MARLPRLTLSGEAHWLIQRGLPGHPVFRDGADREAYAAALREAAAFEQVRLHALALLDHEVHLLARPATPAGLGRLVQSVGRRYVSAYHRRHGGSGTLWDGRYRCAVVEPGAALLEVLCLIDGWAMQVGQSTLRAGGPANALLVDPPEVWTLGNTPFDRQAAWERRLAEGVPEPRRQALCAAALGGWAIGSPAFCAHVAEQAGRPTRPRARGRPRRAPA